MELGLLVELLILAVVIIQFIVIAMLVLRNKQGSQEHVLQRLTEYDRRLDKNESSIRDEFGKNREETNRSAKESREELSLSLKNVSEQLSAIIVNFTGLVDNKIKSILDSLAESSKTNREELTGSILAFEEKVTGSISGFSEILNKELKSVQDRVAASTKESREELAASLKLFEERSSSKIEALTKDTKEGLERNRDTVEKKLADIQKENGDKLEQMRQTVDEKLHKTLETRLGESFKLVSERLELVQKGLGEMQNLAADVGDLKKVMSNVKTKGVLGEYQLGAILEQMLAPGQYDKNVKTKVGSDRNVEFAIKLPNKEDSDRPVWLPIDSKLPTSGYETLVDAYNGGDKKAIEDAQKVFSRTVKNFAKEIHDKYIDPPNTTDFAILFLPFEGEYAEVVRDPELFEGVQRDFKIIVTGPSTIAAFLNALQVGFRSLAVEKRTSEIWNILSGVKKEFGNFENILTKVKTQIDGASKTLDETVGKRTRAINKALKNVETLSDDPHNQELLSDDYSDSDESE
jgi:DNA recombination protein RmuC